RLLFGSLKREDKNIKLIFSLHTLIGLNGTLLRIDGCWSSAVSARRPHTASVSPHPPRSNAGQRVHKEPVETSQNLQGLNSGSSGNSIPPHRSRLPSTDWKNRYGSPRHRHVQRYRPWGETTGLGLYKTGSPRLPPACF